MFVMTTRRAGRTRRRLPIALVGLILLAVGVAIACNQPIFRAYPKRFAVVEDGVLYRSSQPTPRQIANLAADYRIRTLLIVREGDSERVTEEVEYARARGLNVVHIPVKSREPISDEQVRAFFRCVDDPANCPVLMHCSAGRHRTGFLCALYRLERQGWTLDRAVDELLSFKFDVDRQAVVLEQLRHYTPGRAASAPAEAKTDGPAPLGPDEDRGAPARP
jgi:tyrosine-protein phosphatase SIW14